jgi:hypothetical protein
MKYLRVTFSIISLLALTACGGGSSSASTGTNATVAGVSTAAQISVVTAK